MGPQSAVLAYGLRPRANTADLGPITGPIPNYLINKTIFLFIMHKIFRHKKNVQQIKSSHSLFKTDDNENML